MTKANCLPLQLVKKEEDHMMKPEIKQLWVAALRSGDYQQGRSALCAYNGKDERRFCCLGVLCELAVAAKIIPPAKVEDHTVFYSGKTANLPETVRVWSGLSNSCGDSVKIGYSTRSLTDHNDSYRTFKEIADTIEAQL